MTKDSEATPKPDHSTVCVEVRELIWVNHRIDATFAETTFSAKYSVRESVTHPGSYRAYFAGDMLFDNVAAPELAKNLCQADFTRRTLKLVNTRSVESVKAERDRELIKLADDQCAKITDSSPQSRRDALAAACWLRSQKGEG